MKCENANDLRDLIINAEIKPFKGKILNMEYQNLWNRSKEKSQSLWEELLIKNAKFYKKDGFIYAEYLPEKNTYRRKPLPKGRPKKDNKMENRITVRLDDSLVEKLNEYCRNNNCDESEAIRIAISRL